MTAEVVTVPPETPVVVVARLLADRGISAAPVVDSTGHLRGIVTEADLVRRLAGAEDAPMGWFRGLFSDPAEQADRYARTHGLTAADIMTHELVTVTPDTGAEHIAHLLEERHVRRVLVVADGRLRGIVSRADLLRALTSPPTTEGELSDERIRTAVVAAMRKEPWADTFYSMVEVRDGVVTYHGFARNESSRRALKVLAENVPGVKGVVDDMQAMPTYLYGGFGGV
jgi:CBS domain-containing protein